MISAMSAALAAGATECVALYQSRMPQKVSSLTVWY
jgi:hypothetical protein